MQKKQPSTVKNILLKILERKTNPNEYIDNIEVIKLFGQYTPNNSKIH